MEEISEFTTAAEVPQTFEFKGKGSELFGIQLPNWVLTVITLGLYYPWAKAEKLKYIYHKTEFAGSRFKFHGTGKEMFKGLIKALAVFAILYGGLMAAVFYGTEAWRIGGLAFFYLALIGLIPLAIYGQMRYRLSRTSWRGIHFAFTAGLKDMYSTFFKGIFFSIISLGIYSAWFAVDMRKLIVGNIRIGNIKLEFDGDGGDLFIIHLKGRILTLLTLGVYLFWYLAELQKFYIDNILIEQNGKYSRLEANVSGAGFFKLIAVNILILVFTLGLGSPFVTVRNLYYIINNCELCGNLDLENLEQAQTDKIDATMEDFSDILNLDLV
jgi:uncharacterized membrane protein YjgN (DUF898 family)